MNAISHNPYRILGLFANCTERELARQVAKLSRYAEIGKDIESESDLPFLGGIDRGGKNITESAARIEQAAKKIHWALFWFVNVNHIDETALAHLKEGNVEKAGEIWSLASKDKPVTSKNLSAILNLSSLQLGLVTRNKKFDVSGLKNAVQLKGKLIASDAFASFIALVAGKNSLLARNSVYTEFVDEVLHLLKPHLNKRGGVSTKQLVSAFAGFPEDIRSYLSGKFTAGPVRRIEGEVAKAKESRIDEPGTADEIGVELFKNTEGDLADLEAAIGPGNVQYQITVNKVAQEILQCSIDYFNEYSVDYDPDFIDPGPMALELVELVRSLKPTGEVKHRLDENAPAIESWVEETRDRDAHLEISGDLEFIKNRLDWFQSMKDEPMNALQLLKSCRPKLERIALVLGDDNELYLNISEAVVGNAIGMTISAVNTAQEKIPSAFHDLRDSRIVLLRRYLVDATNVLSLLTKFDMSPELRSKCETNGRVIVQVMGQLGMKTGVFRAIHGGISPGEGQRVQDTSDLFQLPQDAGLIQKIAFVLGKRRGLAIGSGVILLLIVIAVVSDMTGVTKRMTTNSNSNRITSTPPPPPNMVLVAGTTFSMGRTKGGSIAEGPAHTVVVKSFYIDVNETTNAEYQQFINATNRPPPASWKGRSYTSNLAKYPVVGVSYADAEAYAKWVGKRLPTEEEWELAARGTDGRIYPWGNTWQSGNANANPIYKDLSAVASYKVSSPYGLFDVIGNAWEWTSSDFKPYPGGKLPREYLGKTNLKTIRGGSFSTPPAYATTTYRIGWPANGATNYDMTGFRCAKDGPK